MSHAVKLHWFKDAKRKKMDIDFSALFPWTRSPQVACVCVNWNVYTTVYMCELHFWCVWLSVKPEYLSPLWQPWILTLNTPQSILSWNSVSTSAHSSGTAGNLPIKPTMLHSSISNQLQFTTSTKRWCSATLVYILSVLERLSWTQQEEARVWNNQKKLHKKRKRNTPSIKKERW